MKLLIPILGFYVVMSLSVVTSTSFTDAEIFERLQHFKDNGVPGTVNDIVNQAMIADGTCRLFMEQDGYTFWHNRDAVVSVINAIKNLPDSSHPSHLVLTAHEVLPKICNQSSITKAKIYGIRKNKQEEYSCSKGPYELMVMAQSMNNWQRAICATEDDSAWNGLFDPAYQPQQISLTSGFMCILACDCNLKQNLGESTFKAIASDPERAKNEVCTSTPWRKTNFTTAGSDLQMFAKLSTPLIQNLCMCS